MKVIIFGTKQLASLAWYCLRNDTSHEIVGFTVDRAYRALDALHDLPVVDFESVEEQFPPSSHHLLVPLGASEMNNLRRRKYLEGKAKGYAFISYVSSRAITWPDLTIGENCMIFEGTIVQPFATIGDNVIVRSGCHISHHTVVEDHCFFAPRACLAGGTRIGERTFLGANSTVRDGISIGRGCLVGAGACVTTDTAEDGIYTGVPARRSKRSAGSCDTP